MPTRSLVIADLSAFTKALRAQLLEAPAPSHLKLMNMLARAAGHRSLQALDAATPVTRGVLRQDQPPPVRGPREAALTPVADAALRQFDARGRLMRWPTKFTTQRYALWALWPAFAAKREYSEREVNAILNAAHTFGDPCTLRRELITMRLMEREDGGRVYRKRAARPEPDVAALLAVLRARQRQAQG